MTAGQTGTPDEHQSRLTRALVEAGMALGSALSLEQVLQILVDVARELVDARYAALGVINPERTGLSDFVTSGMSPEVRARIGALPQGRGILGLLIHEARPLRLRDLREHPSSAGVPANHPVMRSFMGAPVIAQGRVFGNLYVTEKIGAAEFSEADLALLEVLATQAAVAIENANLRTTRDRVVAAARHALGNALAGVQLWTGSLLNSRPAATSEWIHGVRQIAASAAQAKRLVDDLIVLSEIQENRLQLTPSRIDLADVIRRAAGELRGEAEAAGVQIDARTDGALFADVDADHIEHALRNVVANAVSASGHGGRVAIEAEARDVSAAEISVVDSGPVPDLANLEALFEPSVDRGVHTGRRGFGFELAVARQLARLMGGNLTIQPRDRGAAITLSVPLVMRDGV
jgi:signal transduction histidine kinase